MCILMSSSEFKMINYFIHSDFYVIDDFYLLTLIL